MKSPKLDTAIILISEITKGMKSFGSKALLGLNNNLTILDHQIQYLKKHYNPAQIILCTGFDHNKIVEYTKKYKNIHYYFHNNYIGDNQAGCLVDCIKDNNISDALIMTNGVILFNKIKLSPNSSTYFIKHKNDKKNNFEIGTSNIDNDGYLFYDLDNKWIELVYLNTQDLSHIKNNISLYSKTSKLFLFELINQFRLTYSINFVVIDNIQALKINSVKDMTYAKKIYKKYSSILCQ